MDLLPYNHKCLTQIRKQPVIPAQAKQKPEDYSRTVLPRNDNAISP